MEWIQQGRIYAEPGVDLQLPESHLAFRLLQDFTGRLAADGTFKTFSADRQLSGFVFVHGPGTPMPANWMSTEFTIDGEKLVATGQLKHARSDSVYRSFEGDRLLCYKFEKTNRRGAGLHGSAATLKTEAHRSRHFSSRCSLRSIVGRRFPRLLKRCPLLRHRRLRLRRDQS